MKPAGVRRIVVKKPVARVFSSPVSESIQRWTSSLVAPAG